MHRIATYFWVVAGAGSVGPGLVVAQAPPALDDPGLHRYVEEVLTRNTALAAARLDLRAAGERIAPAGALPDPVVGFGMQAVPVPSFDFEREAMTQLPIGIRQDFPFPGKQGARTDVARRDSSVRAGETGRLEAVLAAQGAGAFFALAYADAAVEIWHSRIELAARAVATARARYETGAAPQADLLRAELQRAGLVEAALGLAAEAEEARARIDALRAGPGDAVQTPILTDPESSQVLAVVGDTIPGIVGLRERLILGNPELRVGRARVEGARAQARVFAIAARPDFFLSLQNGVRFGGRQPFLTATAGLSVPIWASRKQKPAARAAAFAEEAEQARYEDRRARLEGELQALVARLGARRARVRQLRDEVLPLAEAASESALASYATGASDLTAVLEAQDDLFEARLQLARLVTDFSAERAALSALLGEEWYR